MQDWFDEYRPKKKYYKNDISEFGTELKRMRVEKKIGVVKFARLVHVSPSYIINLEDGIAKMPKKDVLKRMSEILECPESELLELATKCIKIK